MSIKLSGLALRRTAVMVMLASIVLTACGDSTSSNSAATTPAASAPASSSTTAATSGGATTAASGGATTAASAATAASGGASGSASTTKLNPSVSGNIELWHFWGSPVRRNAIRRVVAICTKALPNIKVKETFKPFGDIWTANTAAVAAGTGMPDVIVEDRPKLPQAAVNNIETDLAPLAKRDGIDGSAFWPFTWQQSLYNGNTYGIPYSTDVRVLYWNKNAFKEAGLDPEKPPQTWSELEAYAAKLDKKNPDGSWARIGFSPLINGDWDQWDQNNGAMNVNKDGTKVTVNDPKTVETLNWIKKWTDRYGGFTNFQKFRAGFTSPPNDAFMSGKVAMIADINGYVSQLNFFRPSVKNAEGKSENLDWSIAQLPHNDNSKSTSYSGGFALSIPRGSKNTDAAWEFIKCATNPEAQASWARDTYEIPANMAAANDSTLTADPNFKLSVDAMANVQINPFVKDYANWPEQVGKRTQDIYDGKVDAQTAMDQAQQAIDAEIAKNKK